MHLVAGSAAHLNLSLRDAQLEMFDDNGTMITGGRTRSYSEAYTSTMLSALDPRPRGMVGACAFFPERSEFGSASRHFS